MIINKMKTIKALGIGKFYVRGKQGRAGLIGDILRNPVSYLLALPALLYTTVFGYLCYPYMIIAFQKFNYTTGILDSEWIGFKNFKFFFKSTTAATVIGNTLQLNVSFILCTTLMALTLALVINELKNKIFKKTTQAIMLFPNYLSWVVVSYMLLGLFSTQYGLINSVLENIGQEPINWYTQPQYWPLILTIMRVWKGAGMSSVIYLAAITGIDSNLYEAAGIDGAGRLKLMWHITLPLLLPTVCILMLMSIGRIFHGDFGMIYALVGDNGTLYSTVDVIDTYVYRALRKIGDPSNAMAVGLSQSVLGFVMVFGTNWLTRRFFADGALF